MPKSLAYKILESHLVEGDLIPGKEIAIRVDHTLLQDATGTMAMLEFESLDMDHTQAEISVQYVDHNILQTDNKNSDDHKYLQTVCGRYGIHFSPPGNGISHQLHMECFGVPGKILLGADSHTPSAAGVTMLGIGAGGMDVAMAMAGYPYFLPCPRVLGVKLTGRLPDWVSAKDIILEMLRRYGVKGCVGKIVEYYGPGVSGLTATDRETIGNMGAELGATSTLFPSDENTRTYLEAQGRGGSWVEIHADEGAEYDEKDEIDLSTLEPLIACPSSPDNVIPVKDVAGTKVDQVIVGSCVNSSYRDLMVVSHVLNDRHSHPDLSLYINPGSQQVLENVVANNGILAFLRGGARIHQCGCLGCIGMGQAPGTGHVSLRTFPRNFSGRSGTRDDKVYLCSPETAIASAIKGVITDPRDLGAETAYPRIQDPKAYLINRASIIYPSDTLREKRIIRGPNIKPLPRMEALPDVLDAKVGIKVGDNISTDTIMPAGSKILPLRSDIEAISRYVFGSINPGFYQKAEAKEDMVVIGGENYGQGSSREHAALAPRYLGVRVKIAKSFARIHKANLCNFGILPLIFKDASDYELFREGSNVIFPSIREHVERGDTEIPVEVDGKKIMTILNVSERQRQFILAGSALNYIKAGLSKE
ncbi:MAG: aconitate hydratase [Deltaproteobacteria bacterium]|nr:aconitate hydratase [Deltaproteobacteria bacterium]